MDTQALDNNLNSNSDKNWFFFTILFIILDYGRPQDILPIGFLRPAMIVNIILIFYIFKNFSLSKNNNKEIRYIFYFIVLVILYVPFARNNYFAYLTARTMLLYLPFILSVVSTVTTLKRLKKFILILICLMVYVTSYCLSHNGVGSGNYFADENDVSLYINMYLPFCYFLFFYENKKSLKFFYASAFVVGLAGILISFSRGGFVGLLAVASIVWLTSQRKIPALIIIFLIGSVFYFSAGSGYIKEMETITNTEDNTAAIRFESWIAAWHMFLDNPLGVGGNNFQVRFPEYQSNFFNHGMWGRVAHSLWFTLIPELGIPGIFIYFSLLLASIKDLFFLRRLEPETSYDVQYLRSFSLACMASFAGYFASGTFISVLYYAHYWYLIAILVAAVNISRASQTPTVSMIENKIKF